MGSDAAAARPLLRGLSATTDIAIRAWMRAQACRASLIAAGCAFFVTLALFPGLSVLLSLYGLAFRPATVVGQLQLLRDVLPPEAFILISRRVHVLVSHRVDHLQLSVWLGLLVALWSASTGTKALLSAVEVIHGNVRRHLLKFQLIGVVMTLGAVLAVIMALGILLALPGILHLMGVRPRTQSIVHSVSVLVLLMFVAIAIAALYRFGTAHHAGDRPRVWPGTLVATTLWIAGSVGFSSYVEQLTDFDATYGPLAAFAGVMLWFWISSYVVLFGAALNACLRPRAPRPLARKRAKELQPFRPDSASAASD